MSLIDALNNKPEPRETKSRVAAILLQLGHEEQAALETALRSPEWTSDALARTLREQGYGVSESSVRRYRKDLSK